MLYTSECLICPFIVGIIRYGRSRIISGALFKHTKNDGNDQNAFIFPMKTNELNIKIQCSYLWYSYHEWLHWRDFAVFISIKMELKKHIRNNQVLQRSWINKKSIKDIFPWNYIKGP